MKAFRHIAMVQWNYSTVAIPANLCIPTPNNNHSNHFPVEIRVVKRSRYFVRQRVIVVFFTLQTYTLRCIIIKYLTRSHTQKEHYFNQTTSDRDEVDDVLQKTANANKVLNIYISQEETNSHDELVARSLFSFGPWSVQHQSRVCSCEQWNRCRICLEDPNCCFQLHCELISDYFN